MAAEQKRNKREQLNQLAAQSYFGVKMIGRAMSMDTSDRKSARKRKRQAKGAGERQATEKLGKFYLIFAQLSEARKIFLLLFQRGPLTYFNTESGGRRA